MSSPIFPKDSYEDEELTAEEAAAMHAADALRPSAEEVEDLVQRVTERGKQEAKPEPIKPEDVHAEMGAASPMVDDLGSAVNQLFAGSGLPEVKLNEQEKDRFFMAALEDKPFELDVLLRGGKMKLRFTTLTICQRQMAMLYAQTESKGGMEMFMPAIQHVHILFQLKSINGMAKWMAPHVDAASPSVATIEEIRAAIDKDIRPMNEMHWSAILSAWRVFEAKCILAQKGITDENFWHPATGA